MSALAITIAGLDPAGTIELVRLGLERARQLGIVRDLADSIDATIKANKTPTEELGLKPTEAAPCPYCRPTEPPPTAAPTKGGA